MAIHERAPFLVDMNSKLMFSFTFPDDGDIVSEKDYDSILTWLVA